MKNYDDEYIAQTAPEDFVFEMRGELLALRTWAQAAYAALQQGVQLMPSDQLAQWDGVRAVIESAPLSEEASGNYEIVVCPNCETENEVPHTHDRREEWWCIYCSYNVLSSAEPPI